MFGPDGIARRVVVDPGEVRKLVELVGDGDPKLVRELASSCSPNPCRALGISSSSSISFRQQLQLHSSTASSSQSGCRDSPICPISSRSPATAKGCEQQVLVHMAGNVIFSSARFWSSSLPVSGWKRKTEKARWRGDLVSADEGGGMRWPVRVSMA